MTRTKASVIICASNWAESLRPSLVSLSKQLYDDSVEVLIVISGKILPAIEAEVETWLDPSRFKYSFIDHQTCPVQCLLAGLRASSGDFVVILESGDQFHPEKLRVQQAFFDAHPDVHATLNAHYECSANGQYYNTWHPPSQLTPGNLAALQSCSLSDLTLRRDVFINDHLWGGPFQETGDIDDLTLQIALARIQLASIDQILTTHIVQPLGPTPHLEERIASSISTLEKVYHEVQHTPELWLDIEKALSRRYLKWSFYALQHHLTSLGQELLRKAIRLDHSYLEQHGTRLIDFYVQTSLSDNGNHATRLQRVFEQLPIELEWLTQLFDTVIGMGYLQKGAREILFGRPMVGKVFLSKGMELGAPLDERFLSGLCNQLWRLAREWDPDHVQEVALEFTSQLKKIGFIKAARWFASHFFINLAFGYHRLECFDHVLGNVYLAVKNDFHLLVNRGVYSIVLQSLRNTLKTLNAK